MIEPADREKFYSGRTSGTVCGLDPIYCDDTHTFWPKGEPLLDSETNEWLDDITQVCNFLVSKILSRDPRTPLSGPRNPKNIWLLSESVKDTPEFSNPRPILG